ncbi:MAG: CBS domain-containing protein, partial [Sedimentisphaerales bacterium]|nr:CBS domain-containing protein [Sedimentisphaerales bacterium]
TLYYYRADTLMPRCASLLWFFHKLLVYSGVVVFLKAITHILNRLLGSRTDTPAALAASARHQVRQLLQETRDEGLLTPLQRHIMQYLVAAPDILIRQLMIPLKQATMLDVHSSRDELFQIMEKFVYTRLPVYEGRRDNIVGHIHICRVLSSGESFSNLRSFIEPLNHVSETSSVLDVIHRMHTQGDRMVIVTSDAKKTPTRALGILTIKDLAEELAGEIASG